MGDVTNEYYFSEHSVNKDEEGEYGTNDYDDEYHVGGDKEGLDDVAEEYDNPEHTIDKDKEGENDTEDYNDEYRVGRYEEGSLLGCIGTMAEFLVEGIV